MSLALASTDDSLENTADACEHVVDTMRMVMLKNA